MLNAEKRSEQLGVSLKQLMDNAGFALFEEIKSYAYENMITSCLILVGSGNNGGDGLVAANLLLCSGITPTVLLIGEVKAVLAKAAFCALDKDIPIVRLGDQGFESVINDSEIIVDCVFGTGFHGEFSQKISDLFAAVNNSCAYKIACDLPSGVDCINGFAASGTVKYHKTVSFHAAKLGCLISPAREFCGEIIVRDIGIPDAADNSFNTQIFDLKNAREVLPHRPDNSHKGTFGRVSLIVGSNKYTGAAVLSAGAAMRCGVGLTQVITTSEVAKTVAGIIPEATFLPLEPCYDGTISAENTETILSECEKSSCVLIGCGLGNTPNTTELVSNIVENAKGVLIIDADGINSICPNIDILKNTKARVILTPHPAELSRLVGNSLDNTLKDRLGETVRFCDKFGVTVISKSRESFVYDGECAYLIAEGNSALSKGGSGDMLAGIIAALAAQSVKPIEAAALGAYILGRCAKELSENFSKRSILPRDILNSMPGVLSKIED